MGVTGPIHLSVASIEDQIPVVLHDQCAWFLVPCVRGPNCFVVESIKDKVAIFLIPQSARDGDVVCSGWPGGFVSADSTVDYQVAILLHWQLVLFVLRHKTLPLQQCCALISSYTAVIFAKTRGVGADSLRETYSTEKKTRKRTNLVAMFVQDCGYGTNKL